MARAFALLLLGVAVQATKDTDTCSGARCGLPRAEGEESLLVQARMSKHLHGKDKADQCGDPKWFYQCGGGGDSPFFLQTEESDPWGTTTTPKPYPRSCPAADTHPWCDPDMNSEERAKLLVAEMTVAELAAQVSCDIFGGVPAIDRLGVNQYNYIRENNHGLLWNDICPVPTMFPTPITMGAAFNRTLWEAIGKAAAIEARYNYDLGKQNSLFLQTNFNIFLDPRWGRGQEVPSECPYVNSDYLRAWTSGVQAPEGPGGVPLAGMSCKHFTGYSLEGAGGWPYPVMDENRHNFNAEIKAVDLADTHYPMYEACAAAGAKGMMTSYNAINGVPMAANGPLTNGLARDTWGLRAAVVTDCGAVEDLWLRHKYVKTGAEAATAALKGGTDIECGKTIVTDGATAANEPLLRTAVQRSFTVRFELGEFDPPVGNPTPTMYDQASHAELAFDAAVQGSVLLQNDRGALPLKKGLKIALMGPMADANWQLLGNYAAYKNSGNWTDSPNIVTIRQGLKDCAFVSKVVDQYPGQNAPYICSSTDQLVAATDSETEEPDADVAVLAMGLYCQDETLQDVDRRPQGSGSCQAGCLESEGCDRPAMKFPKGQERLLARAATWKIPVVVIIVAAGPLDLSILDTRKGRPTAVLWTGYPGQQAGTAIAHMLFGLQSPSGKLSQTYYKPSYAEKLSIKDMDMRPNKLTGYPGRTYRFLADKRYVQYEFGHGLSYHSWHYSYTTPQSVQLLQQKEEDGFAGCSIAVSVTLKMAVGKNPMETVLLFLEPPTTCPLFSLAPHKELRRFEKVNGPKATVQFDLVKKDFELANAQGKFELQTGQWLVGVGAPKVLPPMWVTVTQSGCKAWGKHGKHR